MTDRTAASHPVAPLYDAALRTVLADVGSGPVEAVAIAEAAGRVLRQEIVADRDLPPFNRAQMDGYALRSADLRPDKPIAVVARIHAGMRWSEPVPVGACVAIATGAPVPDDLDTVIEHERSDRGNPVRFTSTVAQGASIHRRGSDARAGATLLSPGAILTPAHIALAATVGLETLTVGRRPRISILTSGDEIRTTATGATDPIPEHVVRDSNGPMLELLVRGFGARVESRRHLPDDEAKTVAALAQAVEGSDIVITTGGISAGERDYVPRALAELGASFLLRRVRLQPGGPLTVARMPSGTLVVGLPGNPVSTLVCAHLFLWPIVLRLLGAAATIPWRDGVLGQPVRANPTRQAYRPGRCASDGTIVVPRWEGSGDLVHTAATDGIVELPLLEGEVPAGTRLRMLPWVAVQSGAA